MSYTISTPLEFDLDNGLHVILEEDHFAPVVAVQVWVKVGSADETEDQAGLAHVLEHMLFKGTARRGVGDIAREVEGSGGDINAWTSHDETVFHIVLPSSEAALGLDILSDTVRHSALDETELKAELEVIQEEIKRSKDNPQHRLSDEIFQLSFSKHPYRRAIVGTEESVASFTRERVAAFYETWYTPSNLTLVVAGDFNKDHLLAQIEHFFGGDWQRGNVEHKEIEEPLQNAPKVLSHSEPVLQAYLALSFPAVPIRHDMVPALDLLAVILGQGESSRLVQLLEREKAWVNDISVYPYPGRSAGLFLIETELAADKVGDTLEAITREVHRLTIEEVSQSELEKAKTIVENEAVYQMQTMQGKARRLGYFRTLAGDTRYHARHLERVMALSSAEIMECAKTLFRHEGMNAVLLWPNNESEILNPDQILLRAEEGRKNEAIRMTAKADENGIVRQILPNGVRVLVKQNCSVPLVSFQAAWLAGTRLETDANNGVNNLLARMLTLGTHRRTAQDIAEEIDRIAGTLEGFSGRNTLGMKGNVIARHFERGFSLFAECLTEPAFDPEELDKEKSLVLEEIHARDDSPSRVAFNLFHQAMFKNHPFRFDMLGTQESVNRLNAEILDEYYWNTFKPDHLVVTIVGDIAVEKALQTAQRCFGKLQPIGTPLAAPAAEAAPENIRQTGKSLKKKQTHMVLGFRGLDLRDEDRFALEALMTILSGQGGRLFVDLRDKQSLCYSVSAYHLEAVDPGYLAVYIGTSPDKRKAALAGILSHLNRLIEEEVGEEELARIKRYLTGSHDIGLQKNSSLAGQMLLDELYDLGYDAYTRYKSRIAGLTSAELRAVARRLIRTDAYVLAEVGPDARGE